jgi:hypothetical protein
LLSSFFARRAAYGVSGPSRWLRGIECARPSSFAEPFAIFTDVRNHIILCLPRWSARNRPVTGLVLICDLQRL